MIVVDASVAVKWIAPEPDHELAGSLLHCGGLVAPLLLVVEVANTLRRKVDAGELGASQALAGLAEIERHVELVAPGHPLLSRAFAMSLQIKHPFYDCLYLALGESRSALVATFDKRFRAGAVDGGYGALIGTWPLPNI